MAVVVELRTAAVVVADRTATGNVSAFQKSPRLRNDAGLLLFSVPLVGPANHNSLGSLVFNS
jgi:hypothetical protein